MIWITSSFQHLKILMGICITGALEYSFHVFPATPLSSTVLQISHITLLLFVIFTSLPSILEVTEHTNDQENDKILDTSTHKKKD